MENTDIRSTNIDMDTNEFLKLGFMFLLPSVMDDIISAEENTNEEEE